MRASSAGWVYGMVGLVAAVASLAACGGDRAERTTGQGAEAAVRFADDAAFLREHADAVVLASEDGRALVAVSPFYQGRVMTSSAEGPDGRSFGWINRPIIEARRRTPHMTAAGGEDRFWLGPEGGQYGLYFPPGAPFDFEHWEVPTGIDWGAWEVTARSNSEIAFHARMQLQNHSGTTFDVEVERVVALLSRRRLPEMLGVPLGDGLSAVGFETRNTIKNAGDAAWQRETGLVSIWILGMFSPSPRTTVVVPFVPGDEGVRGRIVNAAYFGEVPPERLAIRGGVVLFRGDGLARGKIGLPKPRARPLLGSWDAANDVLTLVQYSLRDEATDYVCSMWEEQAEPYAGDVVNSYNDGPPEPGAPPLGPFYELESSSEAASLRPGGTLNHVHRTVHLTGPRAELDAVARAALGIGLEAIEQGLPR